MDLRDYPPNWIATEMIASLSDERLVRHWAGHVALVAYDPASRPGSTDEVSLRPGPMSPELADLIDRTYALVTRQADP